MLVGISLCLFGWIEVTDPSCVPSAQPSAPLAYQHQNQMCLFCTERCQHGFQGPWTKAGVLGENYYHCTRRRHCTRCNRCVSGTNYSVTNHSLFTRPGLDHHCEFLNQCICDYNYKQFVGLLASFWCSLVVQFAYGIAFLVNYHGSGVKGLNLHTFEHQQAQFDRYSEGLFVTLIYLNEVVL